MLTIIIKNDEIDNILKGRAQLEPIDSEIAEFRILGDFQDEEPKVPPDFINEQCHSCREK